MGRKGFWTVRMLASKLGIPATTVNEMLLEFGYQTKTKDKSCPWLPTPLGAPHADQKLKDDGSCVWWAWDEYTFETLRKASPLQRALDRIEVLEKKVEKLSVVIEEARWSVEPRVEID